MTKNRKKSSVHYSNTQFSPNHLLIAIPTRGMISTDFTSSLLAQDNPLNMTIRYRFEVGGEVDKSRNSLVNFALRNNVEYLVFIDDDVIIPANFLNKLVYWAKKGHDIVSGVYYSKQIPPQPLIFKGRGNGYQDSWKLNDIILDADGIGMGMTLINTKVFRSIPRPWFKSVTNSKTKDNTLISIDESLYFCDKLKSHGFKILIDTSIQGIHYDAKTKSYYFNSNGAPVAVQNNKLVTR